MNNIYQAIRNYIRCLILYWRHDISLRFGRCSVCNRRGIESVSYGSRLCRNHGLIAQIRMFSASNS